MASEFARIGDYVTDLDYDPNKSLQRWVRDAIASEVERLGITQGQLIY